MRVAALPVFIFLIGLLGASGVAQDRGIADFPRLDPKTDWPWWRGPLRNGDAIGQEVPTDLSDPRVLRWKVKVSGRSHSSPTVVGDRIFLSTADEKSQTQSVLAFARTNGKQLWQTDVNQGGFPAHNHPKNTEATPTVVSDGEHLFATFFHHKSIELVSLDRDGKILWRKTLGPFNPQRYEYGYAPSPVLYRNSIIVCAEYDGKSFMTSVDRRNGEPIWRIPRPESTSFSSPVIASIAGHDQLLLSGNQKVSSYDPVNGKLRWDVDGTTYATCGTMIWEEDVVFASGGYPKSETIAVKADGSKKILWRNDQKCYEQSMIVWNGFVYALTDKGVLYCWRGTDGKEMWNKRLRGPVSASPVRVGESIFWANELGTLYVFKATPDRFEMIAENHVGDESFASPAVCGGELFLRVAEGNGDQRQEYLVCFGR